MLPEQPTPQPYQQVNNAPQTPISYSDRKKGGGVFWKILVVFFLILLLAGVGTAGYMYYQEKQAHDETKQALAVANTLIVDNAQILQDAQLEPSFRKSLQDGANQQCSSNSAILFNTTTSPEKNADGTIKKFFAVGQFVCNSGEQVSSGPVRFVAVQSYDEVTWEFTYGSSTAEPVSLPGYIFNTDPALFNRKYNNPKSY